MRMGLESLVDDELAASVEETRAFYVARAASRGDAAAPDPRTPQGLREVRRLEQERAAGVRSPTPPTPPIVEAHAEFAGRTVPVRIVAPEGAAARAVHLDVHGGGFYMGLAARGDERNRALARDAAIAVVSVEYRLAPEHPWPAAPDDCETAALWLVERCEARFGTGRLTIGGVSAGATLAMATLLRLRDRGMAGAFAGAALEFGTYDLSGATPAGRLIEGEYFIEAYAGHAPDRTAPDISPIFGDLHGLPAALLLVGQRDILLGDNLAMAARLCAAGCEVDVRVYPESPHGFTLHPTPMARAANRDVQAWLTDRVARG